MPMTSKKDDNNKGKNYDVGYGKPPAEHQFKKGNPAIQPGGPKRRILLIAPLKTRNLFMHF